MARNVRRSPAPIRSEILDPVLARLDEFATLPANWDSYGATTPTPGALDVARALVVAVSEPAVHGDSPVVPEIFAPIPDGGIQVEWQGPAARIEVQVAPDGSLGYLIERSGEGEPRFEEVENLTFAEVVVVVQQLVAGNGLA